MGLKHAGHGHDPEGIGNTSPGSLTVECPACLHPGQNLPENWREASPLMFVISSIVFLQNFSFSLRFLYILYISIDANFKLKGKDQGLEDIKLMLGWGPFVEELAYQDFIVNYVDQPEVSIFLLFPQKTVPEYSHLHRSIHMSPNMTPSLGPRHDAHLATLSLVWVL